MLYFAIKDLGNEYLIVSAQTDDYVPVEEIKLIQVQDTNLFTYVAELLVQKKIIKFSKYIEDLKIDNLVISDQGSSAKESFLMEIHKQIAKIFNKIPQYTFFKYTYLNTFFASKNIFLTVENKEEKYIEILEKDDEELLSRLEEFLNVLQRLDFYDKMYQKFMSACDEIENTDDEMKWKEITDEAITFFDSNEKEYIRIKDSWYSILEGKRKKLLNADE